MPKQAKHKKAWKRLLFLEILIFAFLYSLLSLRRHARFDSFAYDLGIFDQAIWLYSRFKIPFSTIKEKIILGDHFNPSLIFLGPLFWFWNNVRILLIFQTSFLSLSAYPIFLLAKKKQFPDWFGLIISGIYLSFFGFQHALNFDFHATVLAAGLTPWLIYFLENKKWLKLTLLSVVFAGLKENLSLTITALGLIVFLKGKRKRGAFIITSSLLCWWLIITQVIPAFSPLGYEYQPDLPNNLGVVVTDLFWPKEKLRTWFYSLGWFSFLPLLAPINLIPVIIDLAQHFLAGEKYSGTWGLFMHYRASLGPFLVWGMIEGLNNLRSLIKKKISFYFLSFVILLLPLFWQYQQHLPLNRLAKKYYWQEKEWMGNNRKIIASIKPSASVVTQNNLVPHLSHREKIYLLWVRKKEFSLEESPCGEKECWWLFWPEKPQYLLVDLHQGQWLTHLLIDSEKELKKGLENLDKKERIKLIKQVGDTRLYQILYNEEQNEN